FKHAIDIVIYDAVRIPRIVAKDFQVIAVESVQTGNGPDPHEALTILVERLYLIMGEPVIGVDPGETILFRLAGNPGDNGQRKQKTPYEGFCRHETSEPVW